MKFYDFSLDNQSYIEESILTNGLELGDDRFALSTLAGGVLIIDKKTGELLYAINYRTGLPGDEVAAIARDKNNGLWISHAYGITRADLDLPVKKFSTYPGIEGNLINTLEQDSLLYLATGEGLYRLEEGKNYQEKEITFRVEEEVPVENKSEEQTERKEDQKENREKTGNANQSVFKKFFNKIFGGKKEKRKREKAAEKEAGSGTDKQEERENQQEPRIETRVSYQKKKIASLLSLSHQFEKIEGIEGRCEQLVPYQGGLLAGTHNGLYHVNGKDKVTPVIKGIYPHQVYPTDKHGILLATPSGIKKAIPGNREWQITDYLPQIEGPIYSLTINDKTGALWAGGEDQAYKVVFNRNGEVSTIQTHSLSAKYPEKHFVRNINDDLYILVSTGIYRYRPRTDTFVIHSHHRKDSLLQSDYRYLLAQPGISWIKREDHWERIGSSDKWQDSLSVYLRLFDNIQNISLSSRQHLWVISENELYRINLNNRGAKRRDHRTEGRNTQTKEHHREKKRRDHRKH
ncbi:MAG: hypothetical protein ACLFM7_05685 [Bacteroidales bacterium]